MRAAVAAATLLTGIAAAQAQTPAPTKPTRVIYFTPADRAFTAKYEAGITHGALALQAWYREKLGKTFLLADRIVERCKSSASSQWFEAENTFNRVLDAVKGECGVGGFDDPQARYIVYADLTTACNAPGRLGAGTHGVTIMPAQDMRGLSGETTTIDSCGQPWTHGIGRWIGGAGHELGHSLGLPHPPGCDTPGGSCDQGALMWAGYANWPNTYFRDDERTQLDFHFRAKAFLGDVKPRLVVANAASYAATVAPGGLAAAFGVQLAARTEAAANAQCTQVLGDRRVLVRDAHGEERAACLRYVSPTQINFEVPAASQPRSRDAGTPFVAMQVRVADANAGETVAFGLAEGRGNSPGLFMVSATQPAAYLTRVRGTEQRTEPLGESIDLGPQGDRLFLILYATGLRGAQAQGRTQVIFGNNAVVASWAGPAPGFPGVEQINVEIPRSLIGAGATEIRIAAYLFDFYAESNRARITIR